jgi:hypothetical protein
MKKKASLSDLQVKKPTAIAAVADVPATANDRDSAPDPGRAVAQRPAPVKKPHISVYLTPEALEQLTDLGYELRRKPKDLHQEAFNLLFAKHGKPQIA